MSTKKCPHCGIDIDEQATRCYSCKEWVDGVALAESDSKPREFLPTALLSMFLGQFGIHRFYTGHMLIGALQLITLGGCGIWALVDYVLICFNQFKDAQGRLLNNYDKNLGVVLFVILLIPIMFILLFILGLVLAIAIPAILRS